MNDQLLNTVVIKVAEPNDLPHVFSIVDSYADGEPVDPIRVKNSLRDVLYMQGVFMATYNGVPIGGVAGYAMPCLYRDELMFVVMFFYIKPEYRHLTTSFMKEFELVLTPTKCNRIVYGALTGDKGDKFKRYLQIMGYREIETHYGKAI